MSHTTSAMLSRSKISIAIVGGTGILGQSISTTVLSKGWRPFFSQVLLLTRDPDSPTSRRYEEQGAQLIKVDDTALHSPEGLEGVFSTNQVDVVINALGSGASNFKDVVMHAAVGKKSGVRVYIPSEFGVDHRLNDFGDFEHKEWAFKKDHAKAARELSSGRIKIIAVYTGLFLDTSIAPYFGFDGESGIFTPVGTPNQRVSFTSKADIARSIAQLSILACNPSTEASIPDDVRIAGSTHSFEEIARIVSSADGGRDIRVEDGENLADFREKVRKAVAAGDTKPPAQHIRILMGEGKLDFSTDNHNEIVNPRESIWKWKTVEDQVQEA